MSGTLNSLLHSRKFLLLLMDAVLSIVLYFVGKYGSASLLDDMKFLIGVLQPVWITIIYTVAKEDAAAWTSGVAPSKPVK